MAQALALSPALRPWVRLGLDCLLLDSTERVGALRRSALPAAAGERPQPPSPPVFRKMARPEGDGTRSFRQAMPSPARRQPPVPPHPLSPDPRDKAQAVTALRPAVATHAPAPFPAARGHILPPEKWPPAWRELLKRRMPPRPLVCWTYAGLGADLSGKPDPARRELVARMIGGLGHPSGTHVFWPFELPDAENDTGASLFWSGEALLHPRVLLIMGSDARDALGLPKIGPYCQKFEQGRKIIQLPRPQSLVEKQEAFRQAMAFLSALLRFCHTVRH